MWAYSDSPSLEHHGIKGQRWGVRRYQNADGSLTSAGKKRYLKEMHRDQTEHFKKQLSREAAKVTSINRNGYDSRGSDWNDAYRKGKVSRKDDADIRRASKETRAYMKAKYGESAVKALSQSGILGRHINDFDTKVPLEEVTKSISKMSDVRVSSFVSSKKPSYNHSFAKEDPAPCDGEVVDRLKRLGART